MAGTVDAMSARPADQALQQALARAGRAPQQLAEILGSYSVPLIAFTADRWIRAANPAAEAFFGYGAHELDGLSTDVIVAERFRQPNAPPMLPVSDLTTVELPGRRRDGTEILTTWTFSSTPTPDGPLFVMSTRDAARAALDRFRAIYESALDGIVLLHDDHSIADVNPAACRLLGRSREELVGMSAASLMPPAERERDDERNRRFRADGALTGENATLLPDGTVRRAEFAAVANVAPGLHVSTFRDIEDRKRAEEAQKFLDEAATILAASLDYDETLASVARLAVPRVADWVGVDLLEQDGSFRRVAVAHVEPAKIQLGDELRRLRQPSLRDSGGVGAVVRTGMPELFDVVTDEALVAMFGAQPGKLERQRDLGLFSAMTVPLSVGGRVRGAISLVSAESHRRFGPADLAVAEELARRAGYAIANAMFVRDLQLANQSKDLFLRRAEHLQDMATQLVRADSVAAIAHAFDSAETKSPVASVGWSLFVLAGDTIQLLATTAGAGIAPVWGSMPLAADTPVPLAARTGEPVWMRDSAELLARFPSLRPEDLRADIQGRAAIPLVGGGACIGVLGVRFGGRREFDADERSYLTAVANLWGQALHRARLAEAEREAIRRALEAETTATRKKDEFMAMLGHELRNPLSPIVTALKLLRMHGVQTSEQDIIERQVDHLVRLVDDLLDVSRITRGKIELRKTRVELAEVVLRGLEQASPLLEQRRQPVELDVDGEGLMVDADPARLAQVISNLLTNASKYSDAGKPVRVCAARAGDLVRLTVSDQGIGIPAALLGTVFDVFFQTPQDADRAKGGLGLGLAIVRSLVELHGGRAWAESAGPGQGSAFHIELPLAARREERAGADASGVPALSLVDPRPGHEPGRRVLVVDDNEDTALTVAQVLTDLGHDVKTAPDGVHALRIVKTFKPDVCLLDIGLPAMDGYELARRLRDSHELPSGARLIAVTGYGQDADKQRSIEAGFASHLVKPVSFEDLTEAVGT
jgi:PAS domain S-box-containing protein